jgi:hypothetical protein
MTDHGKLSLLYKPHPADSMCVVYRDGDKDVDGHYVAPALFSPEAAEVYSALRRDGMPIAQARKAAKMLAA